MSDLNAAASGTFKIGGEIEINRLGYGAMRITGTGIWGEPADRAEAIRTLKRLPELGVNFIDTADSYGPDVSEELIREALHPYPACWSPPKPGRAAPARTSGSARTAGISDPGGAEELPPWASSRSGSGSSTVSTRKCRATNSSTRSRNCSMTA